MENLIIAGLPDVTETELVSEPVGSTPGSGHTVHTHGRMEYQAKALNFIVNILNIPAKESDIAASFPVGRKGSERSLLISFSSRKFRDQVYQARTRLKGENIFVNEHLSRERASSVCRNKKISQE